MTTFDRIEPRLPEIIDELAAAGLPDYFDDLLRTTAGAKQRPSWSSLERWLPMGEIARPLPMQQIPWRLLAIAAALVLIVTAGLLAVAGTSGPVPAPFGPAANGSMYFHDANGVIYAGDPVTGETSVVVSGDTAYAYPVPSRDGRRIAYDHTEAGSSQLFVSDADGTAAVALPGSYDGFTWIEWSPNGDRLGIVSRINGMSRISVLNADGSGAATLPIDREVLVFWWLPDGRIVFTGAETPADKCHANSPGNRCALFVVGADGVDPEMIQSAAEFSGLSTSVSPDGLTVLVDRWTDAEPGRLHIVDIESHADRAVRIDNLNPAEENSNEAEFSPDGLNILFDRYETAGDHFAVVPTAGGTAVNIGPEWPDRPDGTMPEAHFSPDARSVLASYPLMDGTSELWLLDVTGTSQDQRLDLPATYAPAWQRVAP